MPNITVNGTGYITLYNNTAMQGWTQDLYVGIKNNVNVPVAIIRFSQSVGAALGATTAVNWSDLSITSATLTLKQRDSCPTGNYYMALSAVGLSDPNDTAEAIMAYAHWTNGFYYTGTQGAGNIVTFDLTNLFKTIPETISFKPNTATWYLFFYRDSGFATTQRFYRRGSEGYTPVLTIEGRGRTNCLYYTDNDWQSCKFHVYQDGRWVSNDP